MSKIFEVNLMKFYSTDILDLKENEIFVFGSNPEGLT